MQNIYRISSSLVILSLAVLLLFTCSNEIEPSPDPGRLQILLQHDPADTLVEVGTKTIPLESRDILGITIYQGKAFIDSIYFILYENTETSFAGEYHYNMFQRTDEGELLEHTIFDSYLPPDNYTSFQFGISADFMLLTHGYAFGGVQIPMQSAPGMSSLITIDQDFAIKENHNTEIKLHIKSFQSVTRYRDLFYFIPKIEVVSVSIK
ncbi:hypothetical protein JXB12_00620 [candidate division KSB1 bacterium]|nr:hypothetical protein [candidate division KSB1 bacterium]